MQNNMNDIINKFVDDCAEQAFYKVRPYFLKFCLSEREVEQEISEYALKLTLLTSIKEYVIRMLRTVLKTGRNSIPLGELDLLWVYCKTPQFAKRYGGFDAAEDGYVVYKAVCDSWLSNLERKIVLTTDNKNFYSIYNNNSCLEVVLEK